MQGRPARDPFLGESELGLGVGRRIWYNVIKTLFQWVRTLAETMNSGLQG